jgi:hypothetical protein
MIIYARCRFYRVAICGFADTPTSAGKANESNASRRLVFITIFLLHHLGDALTFIDKTATSF